MPQAHGDVFPPPRRGIIMPTLSLHLGNKHAPLAHVIPDGQWPNMWRIRWADGEVSDMVNFARAKDAAVTICAHNLSLKTLTQFRRAKLASQDMAETIAVPPSMG
jgi:hypothetical protein